MNERRLSKHETEEKKDRIVELIGEIRHAEIERKKDAKRWREEIGELKMELEMLRQQVERGAVWLNPIASVVSVLNEARSDHDPDQENE